MKKLPAQAEALFAEALALPADERGTFLAKACGPDVDLLAHLVALVAAHEESDSILEPPVPAVDALPEERPGELVGRYKLLEKLGEGGCGTVWAAEQREPVKRRVALKIIKLGMDTKQVVARFEAERQALALMDHPNIAKMLDAGATATGRPFFVMELVRGVPITRYCDENNLTTAQRLELLIKVCHAIQHAHQKGIIHRDIKPSNVLITLHDGVPVPKVIDFGIAKATQQELTEKTIYTRFQQFIGTPAYMSPEQAEMSGLDIDTRSDVYSLGVLLYELVTGRTPFDSKDLLQRGIDEIRRTIREKEPPRPSIRLETLQSDDLTTAARRRSTDPRKLAASVRGDLDWIAMKCLEKDRTRRYDTANGVAMDVQRYLTNEPVVARPPSAAYRARKFVRRHRISVVASAAVLGAVLVGSVVAAAQARRALRAERAANELRDATRRAKANETTAKHAAEAERQRNNKIRWARETALPEIERLQRTGDRAAAFAVATQAEEYIPDDPALVARWRWISVRVTIESTPEGAEIYRKLYRTPDAPWEYVGKTPLRDLRVARELYRWRATLDGHTVVDAAQGPTPSQTEIALRLTLHPVEVVPSGMVYVSGGRATAYALRGAPNAEVNDFWIDQFEVTNRQFKEFVDGGGYAQSRYWKNTFVKDGEELRWQEALANFVDATGRPGPATWKQGTFREGEGEYPVTGVSWFEAAAYAEWAGKRLPSVYHWHRAAGLSHAAEIVPLSNLNGRAIGPVGKHQGMTWCGAYDMAGNAREWSWNEADAGKRFLQGGSWSDPEYMFGQPDTGSPFDRSRVNGFRCIKLVSPAPADLDKPVIRPADEWANPVGDDAFQAFLRVFAYEKTPLDARVESSNDEGKRWRVERVSINAAYNQERVPVILYLPRNIAPPYQTIVCFPGVNNFESSAGLLTRPERTREYVEGGRAVVVPIYKGTFERQEEGGGGLNYVWPAQTIVHRDRFIRWAQDLQRTVDYLETRDDIRHDRLAYVGYSWGARVGPVMLALEPRFKVGVFWCGGLAAPALPEVDPINFAPRVKVPVMMLNARFDFIFPVETSQRPLFERLGSSPEDKCHLLFDSLHALEFRHGGKESIEWLDRYLGPVK